MIKHIDAWFAFARGLGLGIDRMEDIILVTGRHLTKSWVNVAFNQRRPDAGVSLNIQVSGHSHVSLEQEYVCGGDLKLGPTGRVWIRTISRVRCILKRLGHDLHRTIGVGSSGKSMHIHSRIPCRPHPRDVAQASWTGRTCSKCRRPRT